MLIFFSRNKLKESTMLSKKERFPNGENGNLYKPIINLNYDVTKVTYISEITALYYPAWGFC